MSHHHNADLNSGSMSFENFSLSIGERFKNDQYEVIEFLGKGSYAKSYLIKDRENNNSK